MPYTNEQPTPVCVRLFVEVKTGLPSQIAERLTSSPAIQTKIVPA